MSTVCNLFTAVRGKMLADPALQEVLDKRVHFNLPEKPMYPCVVFNIDAITDYQESCRINFSLQLLSAQKKGLNPLKLLIRLMPLLKALSPLTKPQKPIVAKQA